MFGTGANANVLTIAPQGVGTTVFPLSAGSQTANFSVTVSAQPATSLSPASLIFASSSAAAQPVTISSPGFSGTCTAAATNANATVSVSGSTLSVAPSSATGTFTVTVQCGQSSGVVNVAVQGPLTASPSTLSFAAPTGQPPQTVSLASANYSGPYTVQSQVPTGVVTASINSSTLAVTPANANGGTTTLTLAAGTQTTTVTVTVTGPVTVSPARLTFATSASPLQTAQASAVNATGAWSIGASSAPTVATATISPSGLITVTPGGSTGNFGSATFLVANGSVSATLTANVTSNAFNSAVLALNPLNYYKMDGSTGQLSDQGSAGVTQYATGPAVVGGNPPLFAQSLYSRSFSQNSYLHALTSTTPPAAWTYRTVVSTNDYGMMPLWASARTIAYINRGQVYWWLQSTGTGTSWTSTVSSSFKNYADGNPHHIALSYDSVALTQSLLIDGTLVAQASLPTVQSGTGTTYTNIGDASLQNLPGGANNPVTTFYTGFMDDTAYFPSALTTTTEANLYQTSNNGATPVPAPTSIFAAGTYDAQIDSEVRNSETGTMLGFYLPMNDTLPYLYDTQGYFNGEYHGGVVHTAAGFTSDGSGAMTFDGSSGYAIPYNRIATNPGVTANFTLRAEFRTATAGGPGGTIIGYESVTAPTTTEPPSDHMLFIGASGKLVAYNRGIELVSASAVNDGTTKSVVFTHTVTSATTYTDALYINGAIAAGPTSYTGAYAPELFSWTIGWGGSIGQIDAPAIPYFNGTIGKVAFLPTTALTASQVSSDYALESSTGVNPAPVSTPSIQPMPTPSASPTPTAAPTAAPLIVGESFNPTSTAANSTSALTETIGNNGTNAASVTGLGFNNALPTGLVVATTPNASTTCSSGSVATAAGATSIILSGAQLVAGASCSVTVSVTSGTAGTYVDTIPIASITTTQGTSNAAAANASLTVTSAIGQITATPTTLRFTNASSASQTIQLAAANYNGNFTVSGQTHTSVAINQTTNVATVTPASVGTDTLVFTANSGNTVSVSVVVNNNVAYSDTPLPTGAIIAAQGVNAGFVANGTTMPTGVAGGVPVPAFLDAWGVGSALRGAENNSRNPNYFGTAFANYYSNVTVGTPNVYPAFCGHMEVLEELDSKYASSAAYISSVIETYVSNTLPAGYTAAQENALLGCSSIAQENEYDGRGTSARGLSAATAAGADATEAGLSGSPPDYNAPGIWYYVSDGTKSEYVRITSNTNNGATWTARFQYAHNAGTTVELDGNYNCAVHQIDLWNAVKHNAAHSEYAALDIQTCPFHTPQQINSTRALGTGQLPYAETDYENIVAAAVPTPYAMPTLAPGDNKTGTLADVAQTPHYHWGPCNAPLASSQTGANAGNAQAAYGYAFQGFGGTTLAMNPFMHQVYGGEIITSNPDAYGYAPSDGSAPAVPEKASQCNTPQSVSALYVNFGGIYLYSTGMFQSIQEPISFDGASSPHLSNSCVDAGGRVKPCYYSRGNVMAWTKDANFTVATPFVTPLQYAIDSASDATLCKSQQFLWGQRGVNPAGCQLFRVTASMQSGEYRQFWQMMPPTGLYPLGTSQSAGDAAGSPASTPLPMPTPEPVTVTYPTATSVRVNQQSYACNIPSNVVFGGSNAAALPNPVYTLAPNTECYRIVPGALQTPQPGQSGVSVTVNAQPAVTVVQVGTGSSPVPAGPTPIPMQSPVPREPASFTDGAPLWWNYYRTGVYSSVIADPYGSGPTA